MENILDYYRKLKNTLKTFWSMKSKHKESFKITGDESKDLLKSFNILIEWLENIYECENNQGYYLEISIENAWIGVLKFVRSNNCW